jgi:zinc protease
MLACNYLSQGETSPLYKALIDTQLATDVQAHLYPTHDPYLAFLSVFATEKSSYSEIESIVMKTIETLKKHPLSLKKLSLAKESLLAEEAASRDGSRAVALSLAEYVATGNWKRYTTAFAEIEKVTSDDITRVLSTYLVSQNVTIGTLEKP